MSSAARAVTWLTLPGADAEQGADGGDGQVQVVAQAEGEEVVGDVEPAVAVRAAVGARARWPCRVR